MSPRSGVKLAPLLAKTHRTASTVNLKAGTASHRDGWVFAFAPADDDPTATDGRCVAAPDSSAVQASQVSRIAREAGGIFAEAMRITGRRRGAGRPRSVGGRRTAGRRQYQPGHPPGAAPDPSHPGRLVTCPTNLPPTAAPAPRASLLRTSPARPRCRCGTRCHPGCARRA